MGGQEQKKREKNHGRESVSEEKKGAKVCVPSANESSSNKEIGREGEKVISRRRETVPRVDRPKILSVRVW
jgi:hypothetical protein